MLEDFCSECGHLLSRNQTLCPYCGNSQKYDPLNDTMFHPYGIERWAGDFEDDISIDHIADTRKAGKEESAGNAAGWYG